MTDNLSRSVDNSSLRNLNRGGRQKGSTNKLQASLKMAILGALDAKGGQAYLERIADDDPRTFCALLGRVLPMTVQGDPDQPLTVTIVTGVPRDDDA